MDPNLDVFLDRLVGRHHDGWIVIEQDHAPAPAAAFAEEQAGNRRWLEAAHLPE